MNHLLHNEYGLFPFIVVIVLGHLLSFLLLLHLRDRLTQLGHKVDTRTSGVIAFLSFDPLGLAFAAFLSPLFFPLYLPKIRSTWPQFRLLLFSWLATAAFTLAAWLLLALGLR